MRRLRTSVLAGLLFTAACLGGRGGSEAPVTVEVHNDQYLTVAVYAVRDGQEIRLGMVDGQSRGRFGLPRTFTPPVDLQLRADPVGADRTYLSHVLPLSGGEVVVFQVAASLPLSSVTIR